MVRKGAQFWVNMIIKLPNTNIKSVQTLLLIFDTAGNFLMKEFNANKLFYVSHDCAPENMRCRRKVW